MGAAITNRPPSGVLLPGRRSGPVGRKLAGRGRRAGDTVRSEVPPHPAVQRSIVSPASVADAAGLCRNRAHLPTQPPVMLSQHLQDRGPGT